MRIGILGYGNLGRAIEILAIEREDVKIVGVFTRRDSKSVKTLGAQVYNEELAENFVGDIDCMIICRGSAVGLPLATPFYSERFNTVDSFDNHRMIKDHLVRVDNTAKRAGNTSIISSGWDPGLLSIIRLYSYAFLGGGVINTFWGSGVSQGHSEAIRRIDGVKYAVQYTVPREEALAVASLNSLPLSDTERHERVCFVVAEEGKEKSIESQIKSMENYFAGYNTTVNFITEEEFIRRHSAMPHRGRIYASASTGIYRENRQRLYFDLQLDSNPEFTAGVMLGCARACVKMKKEGYTGAYTLFDIPPKYLIDQSLLEELDLL